MPPSNSAAAGCDFRLFMRQSWSGQCFLVPKASGNLPKQFDSRGLSVPSSSFFTCGIFQREDKDFPGRLSAAVIAADLAEDEGVSVAIETIPCLKGTPLSNVERVLEHEPRTSVALDTEFLAFHGELDDALTASWLWNDGVVSHIHLKDFADGLFDAEGTRRYRALGDGAIDFRAFFQALEDHKFSGSVSLEAAPPSPSGGPDVEAIRRSLKRIRERPWRFE